MESQTLEHLAQPVEVFLGHNQGGRPKTGLDKTTSAWPLEQAVSDLGGGNVKDELWAELRLWQHAATKQQPTRRR